MKKGDCFEVAGRNVMDNHDWILCHAQVSGQKELSGKRIWHAWNEFGDVVFDFSNGKKIFLRREKYYEIGKINHVMRFNREQACKIMLKTGNFGPWTEEEIKCT
jgi:hypothetical protein